MRVPRIALGVVVLVSLWSQAAHAKASVITMMPAPLDTGSVVIGGTAMAQGSLSDTNNEHVDLVVTTTCTGAGAGVLTLSPMTNINLNSPVTITATFVPSARGVHSCRVDVFPAGSTTGRLGTFNVRGNGESPPAISVSGNTSFPTVRFNDAAPAHTSTRTYSVSNPGDLDLVVSDVQIAGANPTEFTITSGGTTATIPHNATVDWIVTFDPTAAGPRSATLTFTSNDPATPMKVLALGGSGSTANIGVDDRPFNIVNTGSSSSLDITITNSGTAPKGNLGVTAASIAGGDWFTFSACGGGVDCTFMPPLSVNNTAVVGVKCTPPLTANVNDMQTATVTFTSDTDDALATPDKVSTLTCTAGKSSLATSAASAAFGSQLFGTTSDVQTLTATNNGNIPASFYFQTTGAGASNFTVTAACGSGAASPCMLAPAAMVTFDISFLPTAEDDIVAGVNLVSSTLPYPQLSLSGRGIDRHIMTPPSVSFADTFRNPGMRATVMPVTVQNIGEYPLHVSGLAVTGDPTWSLVDPAETFDVPGLGSHDVMVRFTPEVAGKAPMGTLTVMSDDRITATSTIALTGNGKDRRVQLGPSGIDLGNTGAGVPTRLGAIRPDGLLTITNMDTENAFRIREIVIEGDAVFSIQDLDADAELPAGATKHYDIVFSPPTVGEYEATAVLYLDDDPTPQMSIELHGRALFVDAHGGGGCSTGRGTGGAMVGLLGALVFARRRRRAAVVLAGLLLMLPGVSRADPTRNIQLGVFDPTPSSSQSSLQLQSAEVGMDGDLVTMALGSYASNPLVLGTVQNDDPVVRARTMLSLGGAYAFGHRFEAGLHLPIYTQSGDTVPLGSFGVPPASGTARGDLTLHAKARALRLGKLTLGVGLAVTLPTATDSEFAGSDKASARTLGLVTFAASPNLTLHLNGGAVFRTKATFANVEQRSGAVGGIGASLRISAPFSVSFEAFGETIASGYRAEPADGETMGATSRLTTIEALGAARYQVARTFAITAGIGRGVTSSIGAPDLRGVLMLAYLPIAHRPLVGHKVVAVEPPLDPSVADRDHDRVPDAVDKCPDDPEDRDHFEDEDGCPELDNDKDGVLDDADKCPDQREDKDGFEDADGCPDLDNDKDGIPDTSDKCPNEPEKINGIDDNDGCPDVGEPLVMSTPERLELVESVVFTGSTISNSSANVLGQLGATLRARTDIVRIRITAHVQPSKFPDKDQTLSEQRAAAVRDWLVHWGIDAARLDVRGLGGTKPLVRPTTKGAAQVNDRIELILIERN